MENNQCLSSLPQEKQNSDRRDEVDASILRGSEKAFSGAHLQKKMMNRNFNTNSGSTIRLGCKLGELECLIGNNLLIFGDVSLATAEPHKLRRDIGIATTGGLTQVHMLLLKRRFHRLSHHALPLLLFIRLCCRVQ